MGRPKDPRTIGGTARAILERLQPGEAHVQPCAMRPQIQSPYYSWYAALYNAARRMGIPIEITRGPDSFTVRRLSGSRHLHHGKP